jgi:large subunit ribosomal protein L10
MLRTDKQATVDTIKELFGKMVSAVFVDYRGLDVASVTKLRDELRSAGVTYRVVKNTLARRALEGQPGATDLGSLLTGMTASAWSFEEPGAAARVLKAFAKSHEKLRVKGGLIEGRVIDGDAVVSALAGMAGKDELRATLLATLQTPAAQLVQQLMAPAQNLVFLLKAREEQGSAA